MIFVASRRSRSKKAGKRRSETLEFWYRKKYNLTPHDPRYLESTVEDMETEYWAYHYFDNPKGDEVEDDDFDVEAVMRSMEDNPDDWEDVIK